jgi:hypothetical protein
MSDMPWFVGIDVAKAQLAIALRPSGARWSVPNAPHGVTMLVERMQSLPPTLIVREATGGLERLVPSALATAGLPVVVVNPRQARDCARATGQLATTEARDARALAPCAAVIRPTPRPLPDAQTQARRALLGRRQPRSGMRTAAQNRLAGTRAPDPGQRGAYCLAQCAPRPAGRRPRDAAPGQPAVAGTRRAVAECQGQWARVCPPVAAGTPRVGDAHAAAERGLGRRGAAHLCPWDPPWSAHALGRARAGAPRVIQGDPRGHALQPAEHSVFRAAPRRRERQKSRSDRV